MALLTGAPPSALDLAIGLAIYLKIPPAMRLGVGALVADGDLDFAITATDPTTSQIWSAKGAYEIDEGTGHLVLKFWDEQPTGEFACDEVVYQTAIAICDFLDAPRRIERRIFVQALA